MLIESMRVLKNLFEQNRKWAEKVKESEVHGWIYKIKSPPVLIS